MKGDDKMKKRRKLKRWVKIVLAIIIVSGLMIFNFNDEEITKTTPNGGNYTCKGKIFKVCSGDNKAYKYFE